jgi:hypothetical protein
MSNGSAALSIDYKNGGQVFELDFKTRHCNVCGAISPLPHSLPMIIEPPRSKTAFMDHCMPLETGIDGFMSGAFAEWGDFVSGDFTYKIKKTASGIKTALGRNGSLVQGDKSCPLSMEKVLGLEKDLPVITFVYQLSNHSLTPYAFKFAVEMSFALPGIGGDKARIIQGKNIYTDFDKRPFSMDGVNQWSLDDLQSGVRIAFSTQKPVDVWCIPVASPDGSPESSHAVTLVMTLPVALDGSKSWSFMGNVILKKLRGQRKASDEI